MEADDVFSQLSDKISSLTDRVSDLGSKLDSLQSNSGDSKLSDLKSAVDKAQSDIQQINDTLNAMKSNVDSVKQASTQQTQPLLDQMKRIEDANAAADKKYQDQQGLIGKLSAQAEDAAKMIVNFPDTAKTIANNAVEAGKKEILNIWESSKSDLLNLAASSVGKAVKDEVAAVKTDLKDEIVAYVTDQEKITAEDRKAADAADQEEKIRTIVRSVLAEKP